MLSVSYSREGPLWKPQWVTKISGLQAYPENPLWWKLTLVTEAFQGHRDG